MTLPHRVGHLLHRAGQPAQLVAAFAHVGQVFRVELSALYRDGRIGHGEDGLGAPPDRSKGPQDQ